jgi:pyrroloquinoline quinone (PQQ) biosynthesis protein C
MLEPEAFFAQLNAEIKSTECVDNDFFRGWRNSVWKVPDVQFFADQYYLYIRTFPQILAGLAHRVDDEVVRKELAKTIVSELGDEGGEIHFKLFEKACEAIGVHINGLDTATYIPEAVGLVDGIKDLFLRDRVEAALGGHYTIEVSGLPMISSFYEGFRTLPGSHIESMDYFYLHLLVEREHVEWIQNAVAQACGTEQGQADIRRGALRIAQLLGDFWAALNRHLEPKSVPA